MKKHGMIFLLLLMQSLWLQAQTMCTLTGAIEENGQSAPVTLQLNVYADTIAGNCRTVFPIGIPNSERVGSEPQTGIAGYQSGSMSLLLGDFNYRKTGTNSYQLVDGFRVELLKDKDKWSGNFYVLQQEKIIRRGKVFFFETAHQQGPAATRVKASPVQPAGVTKDTMAKPETSSVDTAFSRYQPLYRFGTTGIRFSVQDAYKEDGDVISWQLDDNAPQRLTLTNTAQAFSLQLSAGKVHTLTITLLNEGGEYGNTPAIDLSDGHTNFHRDISGDYGQVYRLYLLVQ